MLTINPAFAPERTRRARRRRLAKLTARFGPQGQLSAITLAAQINAASVPVINAGATTPTTMPASQRKVTLGYNAAGDVNLITDALGQETRLSTDALGRQTGSTNPLGYSNSQQYNQLDQPTAAVNALQQTSSQSYDSAGRLTAVVNPAGVAIESYTYDAQGRLTRTTDPLNQNTSIEYDSSNRPVRVTDRKGQQTRISYTERGQVASISQADRTVSYQYDAVGRTTEVRDAASVNSTQYDAAGRTIQTDSTTAAGSHKLQYQYDSLDRVTSRTLSGTGIANPEVTTYTWDLAGRLLSHTTNIAGQAHTTSYQYDVAGRLSARKVQAGTQADLITQRYGYDQVERLAQIKYIKAEGQAGEQVIEQVDYGYDAAGRRTSKTALNNNGLGASETPMTATYDTANRMSQISLSIAGATKTYALTYDTNGNLTQKQNIAIPADKTNYTWDASNRLSQIAQTGATQANSLNASFTYDAFGRRIQSSIAKAGQTAQTVQYLYEGAQSLGEIRDGKLSHRLLTGLSLDETIARIAISTSGQKDSTNSKIYLTDALNSVIAQLSDDNANPGALQNSYGYSPYGETVTVGPDSTNNPIQYTSRENDGTGLYFYRARYYDPALKRFISSDPIGLAGGLNTFGYVEGNPLSYADPLGLQGGPTSHNTGGVSNSKGPDICIGKDCSLPPFDPTADGPTPAPGSKSPTNRNDNSASGTLCERFNDSRVKQWVCEKCVNVACSFAGASGVCCLEAHRQCVMKAADGGKDASQCAAQLMTCNAFGGRGSK